MVKMSTAYSGLISEHLRIIAARALLASLSFRRLCLMLITDSRRLEGVRVVVGLVHHKKRCVRLTCGWMYVCALSVSTRARGMGPA